MATASTVKVNIGSGSDRTQQSDYRPICPESGHKSSTP